jgi:hypothetical protein
VAAGPACPRRAPGHPPSWLASWLRPATRRSPRPRDIPPGLSAQAALSPGPSFIHIPGEPSPGAAMTSARLAACALGVATVSGVQAELAGPAIAWFARPRPAASASPARVVGLTSSVLLCTATSRRFGVRGASPRIALTELTWRRFAEGGCVPGRWRSRAADGMLVLAWFFTPPGRHESAWSLSVRCGGDRDEADMKVRLDSRTCCQGAGR